MVQKAITLHTVVFGAFSLLMALMASVSFIPQEASAKNNLEFKGESLFSVSADEVRLTRSFDYLWSPVSAAAESKHESSEYSQYEGSYTPVEGKNGSEAESSGFEIQWAGRESIGLNEQMNSPYSAQNQRAGAGIWMLATISATLMLTGALILANQYRAGGESTGTTELPEPPGRP